MLGLLSYRWMGQIGDSAVPYDLTQTIYPSVVHSGKKILGMAPDYLTKELLPAGLLPMCGRADH